MEDLWLDSPIKLMLSDTEESPNTVWMGFLCVKNLRQKQKGDRKKERNCT